MLRLRGRTAGRVTDVIYNPRVRVVTRQTPTPKPSIKKLVKAVEGIVCQACWLTTNIHVANCIHCDVPVTN